MIELIDDNFYLHATSIPKAMDDMQVVDYSNFSYVNSHLPCDTFNILHIRKAVDFSNTKLASVVKMYRTQGLDFCVWIHDKILTPAIKESLNNLTLEHKAEELGMLLKLEDYQEIKSDLHFHITKVSTPEQLSSYAQVIAANWDPADDRVIAYYQLTGAEYLAKRHNIHLLYFEKDDKALATVELFPSNNKTMGIYGLSTLEDARGQGIGSALMTKALNISKKLGYQYAVLQASKDGVGIYNRLGFKQYTTYYEFG